MTLAHPQNPITPIQENEAVLRLLFLNHPLPMWVYDVETLRFLEVNTAAIDHYGYSREEFLQMQVTDIRTAEDVADFPVDLLANIRKPRPAFHKNYGWRHLLKDGRLIDVELSSHALEFDGRRAVLVVYQDVTRRKQAEAHALREAARAEILAQETARLYEQERSRNKELTTLFSLSASLRQAQNAEEIMSIVVEDIRRLFDVDTVTVSMLTPDGTHFTVKRTSGYDLSGEESLFPVEAGIHNIVWNTQEPFVTVDYLAEPKHIQITSATAEVGPAAFVPIQSEVSLLGILSVGRHRAPAARLFSIDEIRLLSAVGEMVGNAIRRASLFDDTQRQLRQVQALRSIDLAITSNVDLRIPLKVLVNQVINELAVDAAAVFLFNPHTLLLEYGAGKGFISHRITRTALGLGESSIGRAASTRQVISGDRSRDTAPHGGTPDSSVPDGDNPIRELFLRSPLWAGEGFAAYYCVPLLAKDEVKGVLAVFQRTPLRPDTQWLDFLDAIAGQAAIAIDSADLFDRLERSNTELLQAYNATIEGWSRALDLRDKETEGHTQRVTAITVALAGKLGLLGEQVAQMRWGALLHDIGKMGVPDHILLKPGPLTEDEWRVMRLHPVYAYQFLAPIDYLHQALDIPHCHHEKWDGTGYPRGLKASETPLAARIFAVADVWDALTSDRPYRPAWPPDKARDYIRDQAGKHFDPSIVEAFLEL